MSTSGGERGLEEDEEVDEVKDWAEGEAVKQEEEEGDARCFDCLWGRGVYSSLFQYIPIDKKLPFLAHFIKN